MTELKAVKNSGGVLPPPPLSLPPRTSFFLNHDRRIRSTLDYFSNKETQAYRESCINTIVRDGGAHLLALLTNMDKNVPVNFFEGAYGGHASMGALTFLNYAARTIAGAGGALWPIFFCDADENAVIRNAPDADHERALGLFISILRPYVPGFVIGLEVSEWAGRNRLNYFVRLIKYFAPDRYVAMHSQAVPDGGMPDVDAWFLEASWHPKKGDEHSPAELITEAQTATKYGKPIWCVEYNLNVNGQRIREQSRALIRAGFGAGGPTN